jgi:histidinol-phosphate phosphatase family protein
MTTATTPAPDDVAIVVPTVGRPSLQRLLTSLATASGPLPGAVVLVDDRRRRDRPLLLDPPSARLADRLAVLAGPGRGPAAARHGGWRAVGAPWIAFLDDDVEITAGWLAGLARDLAVTGDVAATQGRITVPLPEDRPVTDWERNVAGLAHARWATADMAYRRAALIAVGGFDERFPRAYREDADLGLRVAARGWRIVTGERTVRHPVRPADPWVSLRLQRGNADDALLRARHGARWRAEAGVPRGARRGHLLTMAVATLAAVSRVRGRHGAAAVALGAWAGFTARFAWRRIAPGPRTPREVSTMLATSVAIPPAATWHWLRGWLAVARRGAAPPGAAAVLFDRDGTLVVDVPYNGDPDRVELRDGARAALAVVREAGVPTAVVSNQSGVARGLLTTDEVAAVNHRVERLLGPVGPWCVCPHGPDDGCGCRKPASGLIREAARRLGVDVRRCVVVGDIGDDVAAAAAAGARAVLVPTPVTRAEEVAAAPVVADDPVHAVELALGGPGTVRTRPSLRGPAAIAEGAS